MKRTAQTGMIMIVLLFMIFIAVAVFLMTVVERVSQDDYMNLYVNNLMLSVMKTDTGFTDSNCKLISDAVACAFVLPDWPCGKSGQSCTELADEQLFDSMNSFDTISQNYRYLFEVTPYEFIARTGGEGGAGKTITFGDTSLLDSPSRRTSNYAIQKSLAGSHYNLRVTLYLARKSSGD